MNVGDNRYKPKFVKGVKNDKAILVVDVTDRYENRDYYHKAMKEKVDKYIPCLNHLTAKDTVNNKEILPVVFGSRGAIAPKAIKISMEHNTTKSKMKTIVMNVLRSSIEMYSVTLDV